MRGGQGGAPSPASGALHDMPKAKNCQGGSRGPDTGTPPVCCTTGTGRQTSATDGSAWQAGWLVAIGANTPARASRGSAAEANATRRSQSGPRAPGLLREGPMRPASREETPCAEIGYSQSSPVLASRTPAERRQAALALVSSRRVITSSRNRGYCAVSSKARHPKLRASRGTCWGTAGDIVIPFMAFAFLPTESLRASTPLPACAVPSDSL